MLSLERQEAYRRTYAQMHPGWVPSTRRYQDLVAAHLTATTRVLDLGCGRHGVMERLHRYAGVTVGIDPDLQSLWEHAVPRLALACGVAEALPFAGESVDLVCSSWVFEHLPQPGRALAEVARVLAPGGSLVLLSVWPLLLSGGDAAGRVPGAHGRRVRQAGRLTFVRP